MKNFVFLLIAAMIFLMTGCNEKSENSMPDIESLGGAFGYASDDNRIMVSDDYPNPKELTTAYGNYGQTLSVEYVGWQERTDDDDGRETSFNFDNAQGHIYRVVSGQTKANDGYFLTRSDYFCYDNEPKYDILKMKPGNADSNEYGKVPAKDISKMERRRGRKVTGSGLIAQGENSERLEIFQFETIDGEMLYSLVFMDDKDVYIEDYYTNDCWRAEDCGNAIERIKYDLIFVAKSRYSYVGYKIGVSSWAPESCAHELLETAHGRLNRDDDYWISRYVAPT